MNLHRISHILFFYQPNKFIFNKNLEYFQDMTTFLKFYDHELKIILSRHFHEQKIMPDMSPVRMRASEYAELTI